MISICIQDFSGKISDKELLFASKILNAQIGGQFALPQPSGWGIQATVRPVIKGFPALDNEWVLGLFTDPDQPGVLGYHSRTDTGLPFIHVFPELDKADGTHWITVASHEVLEALIDPEAAMCFQSPNGNFYAAEVCDPVETDHYQVEVPMNGDLVKMDVSDFVLPAWFTGAKGPYDWMKLCTAPYEIRPGGYAQKFVGGQGWTQILADKLRPGRVLLAEKKINRASRRSLRLKVG